VKLFGIIKLLKILQKQTSAMRKLIVVTGGTKGIGRAVIERFARENFDVATCARNQKELEELSTQLDKSGVTTFWKVTDMSVKAQANNFSDYVLSLGRPITILVNNAGYFLPGSITTEPDGTLESMIDANLYSAYYTTRKLSGRMKQDRSGHIFNMCSIASIKAYANGGSYAISKFAMLGFSKCLREELMSYNIRVTAVMPGAIKTRSWDGVDLPQERFMPVEDIADLIYDTHALSQRSVVEEIIIRPQLGDI
jgi:short-subunit dehydrogenase